MNWNNEVTRLLNIQYPFVQAPMLVVTTPQMVAAACEAGCLGSLPLGYSSFERARDSIRAVKALTSKPFSINVFPYKKPGLLERKQMDGLRSFYQKYEVPFPEHLPEGDPFTYYTDLIDLFLEEGIKVISFHFGLPEPSVIKSLKSNGVILMATATSESEAVKVQEAGMDMVIAQGIEAGGNRGTFIEDRMPEIGLMSLIPQICDAVNIPCIAAGGLMQPRSVASAFLLGASGVQMGSLFILSAESGATSSWKKAVAASSGETTVLTRAWSGKYGRCIPTALVKEVKEEEILPSPIQQYLTSPLREEGRKKDIEDIQSFWAGQSAHYAEIKGTKEILQDLIKDTGELLTKPFQF
jgi:nitronate monooxygenase